MRTERARLSRHAPVAKAMDYMLTRWEGFTRFLGDGRLCPIRMMLRTSNWALDRCGRCKAPAAC